MSFRIALWVLEDAHAHSYDIAMRLRSRATQRGGKRTVGFPQMRAMVVQNETMAVVEDIRGVRVLA